MNKNLRDIILVAISKPIHPENIHCSIERLNDIIALADNTEGFCQAHELVNRNSITSNKNKIINAIRNERLKPFRFLINKN